MVKALLVLAHSYIRFSHPDQAKGDSLRRQTELRDGWLARNRVKLDTSLTLEDKGVSGYTGEHRDNPDRHALAAFLALVKQGRIPKGSYLIVENLDRLSREDIIPALSLFLDLIQAGIRIVQLVPVEMVYDRSCNPMQLMMAIMELARGHSESAMKSERNGAAWKEKKRRAAENKVPVTARTPAWLRLADGAWEVIEPARDAIRLIFRWAIEGYGIGVITKKLNEAKVPVVGHAGYWARSYVAKLLNNRAVVGEYQPYRGRRRKREPDGKPIAGYYPAVVSEEKWFAARAALAARKNRAGRLAKHRVNVFTHLLYDARDGSSLHIADKGKKKGAGRILVSYRAVQGVAGSKHVSFPFLVFEQAVLSRLQEIDPREILPGEKGADKTLVLTGQLGEVEAEIDKLKGRLRQRYSDAVADVLERREDEQKALVEQLTQARREAASPLGEAWATCKTLVEALDQAPDEEDARIRLRSALRRIVDGVWCLFMGRGARRLAAVQIHFTGDGRRDYLVCYRPRQSNLGGRQGADLGVRSLADVAKIPGLDLRKADHARRLEEALLAVDVGLLAKRMKPIDLP
jgi:DNA invertase Pin-like site-specific DNA recombinase